MRRYRFIHVLCLFFVVYCLLTFILLNGVRFMVIYLELFLTSIFIVVEILAIPFVIVVSLMFVVNVLTKVWR